MDRLEKEIQGEILDFLRRSGWFAFKNHLESKYCHKGVADITAVKNGLTLWMEVKRPGEKQSKEQIEFQSDIERHGGIYMIVESLDDAIAKVGAAWRRKIS